MKRHILVADDNALDLQKVCAIIENDGYVPLVAKNGFRAIELSRLHQVDMAILDIQMPVMNGFKLTEELRSYDRTSSLPVLIMSGTYRENEDVKAAILAGANDFILKPIDPLILSTKISHLLTNKVDWGEWSLENSGLSPYGNVAVRIEVLSISEMGIRISSTVPMQVKSSPQLSIPFLVELDIPSPNLVVLDCSKTSSGYVSYLSFVGMSEIYLKKIRLFCKKLSFTKGDKHA